MQNANGDQDIVNGCLRAFNNLGLSIEKQRLQINPVGSENHNLATARIVFHENGLEEIA